MRHIILDIRSAAYHFAGRLLEPLLQAIRGIRKTKLAATGKSARQLEAEKQARADHARHLGEASSAILPTQFFR